jgi:pimeloyl-ACP methyl ester carboxylesterase
MRIFAFLTVLVAIGSTAIGQTPETSKLDKLSGSTVPAVDGVLIAYEARGVGPTSLIFIHGWCSNRSFWREQLDGMADKYRVVAIDLPGHGDSGRARQEWSIASFANDVITVIKELDLKRAVLIGHSMGGLVSLEAARLLPQRVIGVIGIDTISDVEAEKQTEMTDQIIAALEADFEGSMAMFMPHMFSPNTAPELVKWATESSLKADQGMALAIMRAVSRLDEKELLSSVDVPVRCIYAAPKDSSESRSFVQTNGKYADFNAVFVEGVGHFLHLEAPQSVNHHLRVFLGELEEQVVAK